MTHTFKSPKFHKDQRKELRMQYGPDKAISDSQENSSAASVRCGSRPQASSSIEPQASSIKHQAPLDKSSKQEDPGAEVPGSSRKHQAP
jgi:hypothetical protein